MSKQSTGGHVFVEHSVREVREGQILKLAGSRFAVLAKERRRRLVHVDLEAEDGGHGRPGRGRRRVQENPMPAVLRTALAALVLCAAVLTPAVAAGAASPPAASAVSPVAAATPTDTATPPGPVDPGTGESPEAKETRVDYAPYVIAAVLILAIGAAAVFWRRGRGGPSSKSVRRARDQRSEEHQ